MSRVLALVEGATEQAFIKQLVAPAVAGRAVYLTAAILGKPRHKGGIRSYDSVRRDLLSAIRQDPHRYCTTMFDYYGLPAGWPGKTGAFATPSLAGEAVEAAMLRDVAGTLGENVPAARFIPYIQMHEFEALLFSEPASLAAVVQCPPAVFESALAECGEPEAIDDHPQSAPSKRILQHAPRYHKVLHGMIAAERIGLETMRTQCPHFNSWMERLEALGSQEELVQ